MKPLIFPPVKKCPWCGSPGDWIIDSLDKGNGRGYPGCCLIYVRCTNSECRAIAPNGKIDDIYRTKQEAIKIAASKWNERKK